MTIELHLALGCSGILLSVVGLAVRGDRPRLGRALLVVGMLVLFSAIFGGMVLGEDGTG